MKTFEKLLNSFDYKFPTELIAQSPATPRDKAKLLIYDRKTKQVNHDIYKNLTRYISKNNVLVLNQTKVLPARLIVSKPTGGKAKILYVNQDKKFLHFLSDKKLEIDSKVFVNKNISFTVKEKREQFYILQPSFKISKTFEVLTKHGQTPLPPYIKNSKLKGKKLLNEYNTVFAKQLGSVAAPTASLHFTKNLLNEFKKSGIQIVYITLHVNLGTFASLSEQQWKSKKLHEEWYEISSNTAKLLNKAKKSGKIITAVGTTVVRTLESAASSSGTITQLSGNTDLFITEATKLKFVDSIITNFHVPKSSLLMLVSSFIGRKKLLDLYKLAIEKKYRLFSFGDGMLIK